MDIMKGSLDDISRPASVSRSRPGSRLLTSFQVDKQKVNSSPCSLEVLTPEPGISQWDLTMTSDDEQERSPKLCSEDRGDGKTSQSPTGINVEACREEIPEKRTCPSQDPVARFGIEKCKDELQDISADEDDETTVKNCIEGSTKQSQSTEDKIDPKLEKAIKKMKVLDEILLKKVAKEKDVKAQGLEIHKQLWDELQYVSQSSARSHEENVNTNKFLALTPQLDDPEGKTGHIQPCLQSKPKILIPTYSPVIRSRKCVTKCV
ncbi:fibrous sheath-interacting protein 1-like [Rhinoderma darwinii]|uniref:fibrous sheath-interacting protein 1-like n=1 Tax=Rhinoderma darwinii TaxID=43563 RepID=UPI003F66F40F